MRKINFTLFVLLCATLLGGGLSAQEEKGKFESVYAIVLADKVNIRAGQGVNFEALGQLNKNTEIVVIGQEYGWYKVKLPREASCFVHKDYIETGLVRAKRLRVRARAKANSNILGVLKRGESVEILQEEGDWLKIAAPENCAGWVKKDYLKVSQKKFIPPAPVILKAAPLPQKEIEARGVINDLGKVINRRGRHKLTDGKKILYYLKSNNLDLNNYLYQKVYLNGKVENLKGLPYPVINVEQIRVE